MFNTIDNNSPYFKLNVENRITNIDTNLYNLDIINEFNPSVILKNLKYLNNDRKITFIINELDRYSYLYFEAGTYKLRTNFDDIDNITSIEVEFEFQLKKIKAFHTDYKELFEVVNIIPADNEEEVPVDQEIIIEFSSDIDMSSVTSENVYLEMI